MVEEETRKACKNLRIELVRGRLKPCGDCAVTKAKHKAVTKESTQMPSSEVNGRVHVDISTIKEPKQKGSEVSVPSKGNWRLIVDKFTKLKFSEFVQTKDGMVKPAYEQFQRWKDFEKQVKIIQCHNGGDNANLEKELNSEK